MGMSDQEKATLAPLMSAGKPMIEAVAGGKLHPGVLTMFLLLSPSDRSAFLKTFSAAQLSFQTQREFLEWLSEIAYSESVSVGSILKDKKILDILNNKKLNWPQRIPRIRDILYHRRFPRLATLEKKWKKLATHSNPMLSNVQFSPSPAFEKNKLEIRINLTEPETATEIFTKLAQVPQETWKNLIYPGALETAP